MYIHTYFYLTPLPICRLLDLKQDQNKEGQTILYLVFEYMDTDLRKYIKSFRASHDDIPAKTVKVYCTNFDAKLRQ